jgi:hypothetical protein
MGLFEGAHAKLGSVVPSGRIHRQQTLDPDALNTHILAHPHVVHHPIGSTVSSSSLPVLSSSNVVLDNINGNVLDQEKSLVDTHTLIENAIAAAQAITRTPTPSAAAGAAAAGFVRTTTPSLARTQTPTLAQITPPRQISSSVQDDSSSTTNGVAGIAEVSVNTQPEGSPLPALSAWEKQKLERQQRIASLSERLQSMDQQIEQKEQTHQIKQQYSKQKLTIESIADAQPEHIQADASNMVQPAVPVIPVEVPVVKSLVFDPDQYEGKGKLTRNTELNGTVLTTVAGLNVVDAVAGDLHADDDLSIDAIINTETIPEVVSDDEGDDILSNTHMDPLTPTPANGDKANEVGDASALALLETLRASPDSDSPTQPTITTQSLKATQASKASSASSTTASNFEDSMNLPIDVRMTRRLNNRDNKRKHKKQQAQFESITEHDDEEHVHGDHTHKEHEQAHTTMPTVGRPKTTEHEVEDSQQVSVSVSSSYNAIQDAEQWRQANILVSVVMGSEEQERSRETTDALAGAADNNAPLSSLSSPRSDVDSVGSEQSPAADKDSSSSLPDLDKKQKRLGWRNAFGITGVGAGAQKHMPLSGVADADTSKAAATQPASSAAEYTQTQTQSETESPARLQYVGNPEFRNLSVLDNLELYFTEQVFSPQLRQAVATLNAADINNSKAANVCVTTYMYNAPTSSGMSVASHGSNGTHSHGSINSSRKNSVVSDTNSVLSGCSSEHTNTSSNNSNNSASAEQSTSCVLVPEPPFPETFRNLFSVHMMDISDVSTIMPPASSPAVRPGIRRSAPLDAATDDGVDTTDLDTGNAPKSPNNKKNVRFKRLKRFRDAVAGARDNVGGATSNGADAQAEISSGGTSLFDTKEQQQQERQELMKQELEMILVVTNIAVYLMPTACIKPTDTFADAPVPQLYRAHPIHQLQQITIFFAHQRFIMHFKPEHLRSSQMSSVSLAAYEFADKQFHDCAMYAKYPPSSPDCYYAYQVLTRDKAKTMRMLNEIAELSKKSKQFFADYGCGPMEVCSPASEPTVGETATNGTIAIDDSTKSVKDRFESVEEISTESAKPNSDNEQTSAVGDATESAHGQQQDEAASEPEVGSEFGHGTTAARGSESTASSATPTLGNDTPTVSAMNSVAPRKLWEMRPTSTTPALSEISITSNSGGTSGVSKLEIVNRTDVFMKKIQELVFDQQLESPEADIRYYQMLFQDTTEALAAPAGAGNNKENKKRNSLGSGSSNSTAVYVNRSLVVTPSVVLLCEEDLTSADVRVSVIDTALPKEIVTVERLSAIADNAGAIASEQQMSVMISIKPSRNRNLWSGSRQRKWKLKTVSMPAHHKLLDEVKKCAGLS